MNTVWKIVRPVSYGILLSALIVCLAFPPYSFAADNDSKTSQKDSQKEAPDPAFEMPTEEFDLEVWHQIIGDDPDIEALVGELRDNGPERFESKARNYLDAIPPDMDVEDAAIYARMIEERPYLLRLIGEVRSEKERQRKAKNVNEDLEENMQKRVGRFAKNRIKAGAESFRTIFLILIITGVTLVRDEVRRARDRGEPVNAIELAKICAFVTGYLLDSGEIWFSIWGAGTMGMLMEKPLKLLQALIVNNVSKKFFAYLLASAVHSFIIFIGWELGGQLFAEARMMIEDREYYEYVDGHIITRQETEKYDMSHGMWSLSLKSFLSLLDKDNPEFEKSRLVFKELIKNMTKILFGFNHLTKAWLYNSLRLRIATGDFVSIIACMVIAGSIGSVLFPGAGTMLGMAFGVVGGIVHVFMPQEYKDKVTRMFQTLRICGKQTFLREQIIDISECMDKGERGNMREFKEGIKYGAARKVIPVLHYIFSMMDTQGLSKHDYFSMYDEDREELHDEWAEKFRTDFSDLMRERESVRNRLLTAYFEMYYNFKLRIQEDEHRKAIIDETIKRWEGDGNIRKFIRQIKEFFEGAFLGLAPLEKTSEDLGKRIVEYRGRIAAVELFMRRLYDNEKLFFSELMKLENVRSEEEVKEILREEWNRADILKRFLDQFIWGYHGNVAAFQGIPAYHSDPQWYIDEMEEESRTWMTDFRTNGFDEEMIVSLFRKKSKEIKSGTGDSRYSKPSESYESINSLRQVKNFEEAKSYYTEVSVEIEELIKQVRNQTSLKDNTSEEPTTWQSIKNLYR